MSRGFTISVVSRWWKLCSGCTGGPFFLVLAEAYRFLYVVEFHTFEPSVFMFQSRSMLYGLLYVLQALVGVSVLR